MKKVIVTGLAGFIGFQLTKSLLARGISVIGIDDCSTGKEANFNHKHELLSVIRSNIALDWTFQELVKHLPMAGKIDCMFHLAAHPRVQPSIDNPRLYHSYNVNSTTNMLELCRVLDIKRFVFSSSSSIYGDPDIVPTSESEPFEPMSPYALHKQVGEHYCKLYSELYGIDTMALRYFNVYGEGQPEVGAYVPVVGIWLKQHAAGRYLSITGDGTQTRDFVNVQDVVDANILAAYHGPSGYSFYNVGSGKNYELNKIAGLISTKVEYITKRHEPHTTLASIVKIFRELGWAPTVDLEAWLKDKLNENKN